MVSHIGEKIKEILEKRAISKSELSRRLNMTSTNVHKIFKRETIDTGLLKKISEALDHDFFQYYNEQTPASLHEDQAPYRTAGNASGSKQSSSQQRELEQYKNQLIALKLEFAEKEIYYLKRINELLEGKK